MTAPKYPDRPSTSIVDPYLDRLRQWVQADSHRAKRDRRTANVMFEASKGMRLYGKLRLQKGEICTLLFPHLLDPAEPIQH